MKILVLNSNILAVDPVDAGDAWQTSDAIYPKHVVEGSTLIEVDSLPTDYAPGRYIYTTTFEKIKEPAPVIPVPESVSMRQARLELLDKGLLDDVEVAIAAAGRAAQIEWDYATQVSRDHPIIALVQTAQGLSDTQIDELFISAAKR